MATAADRSVDPAKVDDFIERSAMVFAEWGFPRMAAKVLMALTVADAPTLTAAELAERVQASPAAISGAVRYLSQLRIIERRTVPGTRKDTYRLRADHWYASSATVTGVYTALAELAEDGRRSLPDGSSGAARVTEMRDFFRFVAKESEGMIDRWHASRGGDG
jgi:predicted transcriptional regulator